MFFQTDGMTIDITPVPIDRENDEIQLNTTCDMLSSGAGYSLIVDLSWGGWMALKDMAEKAAFPYIRLEAANHQFVQVLKDWSMQTGFEYF